MPDFAFRSPNFFEREIDLSAPQLRGPVGTPAGVIGTANKGPAFVPVTIANFDEFVATFGNLDPKRFGPYAVNEFLKHRAYHQQVQVCEVHILPYREIFVSNVPPARNPRRAVDDEHLVVHPPVHPGEVRKPVGQP